LLIASGVLALQEHSTANKWMHEDQQEIRKNTALSSQVSSLNGQVSNLNGQMSNLQSQLSAVANQKAKALDQNAVLTSALQDASSVAADLNTCVNDTQVVLTDISAALSGGFVPASAESDATSAGQFCGQAQAEESALQVVLAGA
jgi:chromosome segregation ATPase